MLAWLLGRSQALIMRKELAASCRAGPTHAAMQLASKGNRQSCTNHCHDDTGPVPEHDIYVVVTCFRYYSTQIVATTRVG